MENLIHYSILGTLALATIFIMSPFLINSYDLAVAEETIVEATATNVFNEDIEPVVVYEDVNLTSEWTSAINASASQNYTISNNQVVLNSTGTKTGYIATNKISTSEHDIFHFEFLGLSGFVEDLQVRNGQGNVLYSSDPIGIEFGEGGPGATGWTENLADYNSSSYYLYAEAQDGQTLTVGNYLTEGYDDVTEEPNELIQSALFLILLIFFLLAVFVMYLVISSRYG